MFPRSVTLSTAHVSGYNSEVHKRDLVSESPSLDPLPLAQRAPMQHDSQDIHLLRELAELGDVSSRVLDQGHRLERLKLEGYGPPGPS